MKAAQISRYGGAEVIKLADDVSQPIPEPGQVVVEVYAAGVNPFDWKVREGLVRDLGELNFPAILGGDFAGVIAAVGADVKGLETGQEVYGQAGALSGKGSFAEFAPVVAGQVGPKPATLDWAQSAALPLAGCSAWQALVDHLQLRAGQKVLIHGGAGGIGSLAIQLAKHLGAEVATTVSAGQVDFVRELGATVVVDYKTEDFAERVHDYDAVFDTVGGDTTRRSYGVLKRGGILVSMAEQPDAVLVKEAGIEFVAQYSRVTRERLAAVAELADRGVLRVEVDRVFPLEQAGQALDYLHAGKQRGKVVIQVCR